MNIPKGYKQTELGIIPEDWEVKPLCEVIDNFTGLTYAPENVAEYGTLVLRSSNIQNGFLSFADKVYVRGLNIPQRVKVKDGDILVCVRNGSKHLIGKCARIDNVSNENMAFGAFMTILRTKSGNSNKFIHYVWQSNIIQSQITENLGATINQITNSDINRYLIITPSQTEEQEAIAEVLSDVDALIAALDKKIEKKRLIKQGTIQELLTGKKRLKGFTDEWVEKKLGKIVSITTGKKDVNEGHQNGAYPFFTCSTNILRSNSYSFDKEAILVAGNGDVGNLHYYKGKFEAYQRTYVLYDFTEHPQYIHNYLSAFLVSKLNEGKIGSTIPYIVLGQLTDFSVHISKNEKEQQAIAAILSDMDKEIAELEARREKYQQLKNGMMQKLLTGQIRLVKPQAQPMSIAPKVEDVPIDAVVIAAHIVNELYRSKGWGRTKIQKALHLVEYGCQLDFKHQYIRNTAGPDDQRLLAYIDQKFKQYHFVDKTQSKDTLGRTHYDYVPAAMIDDAENAFAAYPLEKRNQIDALLEKIKYLDLAEAEIVSTLYAVWNNRLIKQEPINDELLLADFYAWSEHKSEYQPAIVERMLRFMRKNNIVPIGWGKYIDCKI